MIDRVYESNLDLELLFCTNVLKLTSLHYGYSDVPENLTLGRAREAQARYTETLVALFPSDVKRVLDIGCGIGDNARYMADHGYEVTAVSPDSNHEAYFASHPHTGVRFVRSKFEAFPLNERFDLILMSESQNYFDANAGFDKVCNLARPGGYLLISGMLRRANERAFESVVNVERDYLDKASAHGLCVINVVDITDNVLPTLEFAHRMLTEHFVPGFDVLTRYVSSTGGLASRVVKGVLARVFKRPMDAVMDYYAERLDPVRFKKHVKYARVLFQC